MSKLESKKGVIKSILFLTKLTIIFIIIVSILLLVINIIAFIISPFIPMYVSNALLSIFLIIYIIIILIFGRSNYYKLETKQITIVNEVLKNEMNIVYLADFQFDKKEGLYNKKAFNNLMEELEKIDFEILLLGGDYINYKSHLSIFLEEMEKLTKKYKVYSVFGNHDYAWQNEFRNKLNEIGVRSLENEYDIVTIEGDRLCIVGLEDEWTGNPKYPDIKEEVDNLIKLVLIHNPDTIKKIKDEKFDLALAGHYHKGQVNLFPGVYIARIVTKYVYGLHQVGKNKLYITSGVGGTFFRGPISFYTRWNANPEIVKISIKPKV